MIPLDRTPHPDPDLVEVAAAAVHEAYLATCIRLGWDVRAENQVPYSELSWESQELDRASVRAVLAVLEARCFKVKF